MEERPSCASIEESQYPTFGINSMILSLMVKEHFIHLILKQRNYLQTV
jgi:hypothetical protein